MNKKGQALVEFIIVFPILLLILLAVFDIARIYTTKTELSSSAEDIILDDEYLSKDNTVIKKETLEDDVKYTLTRSVPITSPILRGLLGNNYEVIIERIMYDQ